MKNRMFFGTSILKGFWPRFGRGLGSQNHWFSHFFRCFFDAKFRLQLGRAKNRKKKPQSNRFPLLGARSAVVPSLLGREREGSKSLTKNLSLPSGVFCMAIWIEIPRGGHRRPPTLWRSGHLVMEFLFLQVFGRSWRSWFQIWRPKPSKIRSGPSKREARGLQNRARRPPRRHF